MSLQADLKNRIYEIVINESKTVKDGFWVYRDYVYYSSIDEAWVVVLGLQSKTNPNYKLPYKEVIL